MGVCRHPHWAPGRVDSVVTGTHLALRHDGPCSECSVLMDSQVFPGGCRAETSPDAQGGWGQRPREVDTRVRVAVDEMDG